MAQLSEHFSFLDYAIFALYLMATLSTGTLFIKRQPDLNEYLLAGRSMGSVLMAATVLASLFSGIGFLAGPSEGYANGPVYYLSFLGFIIAAP